MILFVCALFYANLSSVFYKEDETKYLSYNDVVGVSFVIQGKEYPLNFHQQNEFLISLNQEMTNPLLLEILDLEKIIVYRFNHPNLIIEN